MANPIPVGYGDSRLYIGVAESSTPIALTFYDFTGTTLGSAYAEPSLENATLTAGGTMTETPGQDGNFAHVRVKNQYLELTLEIKPSGSSLANAKKAGFIIRPGYTCVIANMKIIAAGTAGDAEFTDAFNVSGSSQPLQNRWIVQTGASWTFPSQDEATGRITLRRYASIAATSPVTD